LTHRSCRWLRGLCAVLLPIVLIGTTTGCQLFRRGVVTTDKPAVTEPDRPESPSSLPDPEPEPPDETTVEPVDEPPAEAPAEAPAELAPEEPEKAAATAEEAPIEKPRPAPSPPEPEASAVSVPEVDEVSIIDPAEARLLSEDEEIPLASLERRVTRAEALSATLQERELSEEIAAQVDSGRAFLQNAKEARETGDLKRADVLIDKCLVLLEDAEQQTRP